MKRALALSLLLAACGDNGKPIDSMPDASEETPLGPPRAVVVAGDFVTPGFSGVMSKLELSSMQMTQNVAPAGAIGNDPIIRKLGNELFVVNRAGGNSVTIFDATTLAVKDQLGTGAGSNPQDVATFGAKVFVAAMGTAGIVVMTRGSTGTKTISLAALDPDGIPDCVSAYRAGTRIYVACGLLDATFTPRGNGVIAVIDPIAETVERTITLSTPNPFGVLTELPDSSLVIPTFDFGAPTARCLEQVSIGGTPFSKGCLVQNADVGGYVVRALPQQIGETQMLWMVVNNGDFAAEKARLWGYDLTSGTLWDTPLSPEAQVLTDIAPCPDGRIIVADKTMSANGVRVYDGTSTMEKTTEPLAVGLRPQSSPAIVCY
jgi:DNA-binding beta-propeller fold protein YncE